MSRYEFQGRDARHTIAVGWDNPLQTYFAQVSQPVEDEDEEDPIILWIGADRPGEILSVEDLASQLAPFADLAPELLAELRADRSEKINQPPTPAQQQAINFIRRPK
ncbi:MAG: hypothetical protein KGH75_04975 [Rhodospirillales bacterium]|nr:hypothetical protein [Rhodospirillales bacterium]